MGFGGGLERDFARAPLSGIVDSRSDSSRNAATSTRGCQSLIPSCQISVCSSMRPEPKDATTCTRVISTMSSPSMFTSHPLASAPLSGALASQVASMELGSLIAVKGTPRYSQL
jgi:hypothetical protein